MVTWLIIAKVKGNGFDFVDVLTGSVAGLAAITPCAGYVEAKKCYVDRNHCWNRLSCCC